MKKKEDYNTDEFWISFFTLIRGISIGLLIGLLIIITY